MGLVDYAKSELDILLAGCEDDESREMQQRMNNHILEMVQVFADENHSGFSASYAIGLLEKVLRYHPLTPLTGGADEWNEVEPGMFQNRRCPSVFKDKTKHNGKAYILDGKIFSDDDGKTWFGKSGEDGDVVIEAFPWMPPREQERVLFKPEGV
jgi:hypothetical protein